MSFDQQGLSPEIEVQLPAKTRAAFLAFGEYHVLASSNTLEKTGCYIVNTLELGGKILVNDLRASADYHTFCRKCALRVHVGYGESGVPLAEHHLAASSSKVIKVQLLKLDCLSFLPASEGGAVELWYHARTDAVCEDRGRLDLNFYLPSDSGLIAAEASQPGSSIMQAVDTFSMIFKQVGIAPGRINLFDLPASIPSKVHLTGDDWTSAHRLFQQAEVERRGVNIFLVNCLTQKTSLSPSAPGDDLWGITGNIPGAPPTAGYSSGVILSGMGCHGGAPSWNGAQLGRFLAHEIAHYLGLFHTVEEDGSEDNLADTGPDNLMHYRFHHSTSNQLSKSQGVVMHSHPLIYTVQ